jgi:hypothetical protein
VKETDNYIALGIIAADVRGLIKITGAASQRPICGSVVAAPGNWHNMFDF